MLADWSISKDWLVISKYLHVKPDYSFFISCLIIFCVYINIPICNLRIWWRRWFHVWNEEGSQRGDRGTIYEEWKNVIRGVNCLLRWRKKSYSLSSLLKSSEKQHTTVTHFKFFGCRWFSFYKGSLEDHLFSVKK